jgi:hypothetical protein
MIPITHPEFLPSAEVKRFETYLARMLKSSIRLATISRSSQEEIDRYCRRKFGASKEIAVVPLVSSVSAAAAIASANIVDAGLEHTSFVFMALPFEPRKNQKFLLDLWRAAVPRLSEPPALIFGGGLASVPLHRFPVGGEGWGLPITEALDRGKYCLASDKTC